MANIRISRRDAAKYLEPAPLIILDKPQMGENIGAAARAMLNFGISGLRLVNPRDGWPNPKATATASGAAVVVDGAQVFETMDEALADCAYVLATTARQRELALPVFEPAEAAKELRTRIGGGQRCAILFGGERNGLESEDIARAGGIISIPVNPAFSSLNLAQAVLLVGYEWARAGGAAVENPMDTETPASQEDVSRLYEHLETELDAVGYFFPPEMRDGMARSLRVALTRAGFTASEVRTLRGVIKALAKNRKV